MSPNSAANSVVSVFKRLTLSPAATLYYVYIMKVIKNGKESRPGMLLLRNQFHDSLECWPPIGHKK